MNINVRRLLYFAIFALYLLHNDFWLWNDSTMVVGLPVGLVYHIGFCLAAMALMALLVNYTWPAELDDDEQAP